MLGLKCKWCLLIIVVCCLAPAVLCYSLKRPPCTVRVGSIIPRGHITPFRVSSKPALALGLLSCELISSRAALWARTSRAVVSAASPGPRPTSPLPRAAASRNRFIAAIVSDDALSTDDEAVGFSGGEMNGEGSPPGDPDPPARRLQEFLASAIANMTKKGSSTNQSPFESIEDIVAIDINRLLSENASAITKGDLYEAVLEECLARSASEAEAECLRRADLVLRAAVQAERLRRARLKMKYLFAGAMFNQLEYTVNKLSSNDEIDDYLMQYIGSLIRAENRRSLGTGSAAAVEGGALRRRAEPTGPQGSAADARGYSDMREETLESLEPSFRDSNATVVLRNIRRLLEAELVARSREEGGNNLRVLARLIHDPDDEARNRRISEELKSVEGLMSFSDYLDEASEYFIRLNETQSSGGDTSSLQSPPTDPPFRLREAVLGGLPRDMLGVLGAIRRALDARLDNLRSGLREPDTVYSTDPNDYNKE